MIAGAEGALRDEERYKAELQAMVDTSPVGMVVFDAGTGHPVMFNREARRFVEMLGREDDPLEQLLEVIAYRRRGRRKTRLADPSFAEELRSVDAVRAEEIELSVPEGRSVNVLVNATAIHLKDGTVDLVVVSLENATPSEAQGWLQSEFLGRIGHELRMPLSSIKGSVVTALSAMPELDPPEIREFLRIIDEQADHMRGLIGDLLDVGRIDSGTLSVTPEPVDIANLLERAKRTFLRGGGRHNLLIDLPSDLPRAMADRRRIVQVMNNLFSNATKHAPEASPIRIVSVREDDRIAISVADEGKGIAPQRLPHLFQRPGGVSGRRRKGAVGPTGFGLSICKGLVEAHGGRIWAASGDGGRGTIITFTLPVADQGDEDAVAGPVTGRPAAAQDWPDQVPVLVVDDDPNTLRYVRDALADSEYQPLVTGDPQEIPSLIQSEQPRLVLLDLMLRGTDGIKLMEQIPELADLPVIFFSGYEREESIARALDSGAVDYIVKPCSPMELKARIRAALRRQAVKTAPFRLKDLEIDYEERRVSVGGHPVQLTSTEYKLLCVLSRNAGRVSTYGTLLSGVWGGRNYGDNELVRSFVKSLRRKLGDDAASPVYIINERGVGYRMSRHEDT